MEGDWRDRITVDPAVLVRKPIVRGTRIAVELVLGLVASGWTFDQILASHPDLTGDDLRACFAYVRDVIAEERIVQAAHD